MEHIILVRMCTSMRVGGGQTRRQWPKSTHSLCTPNPPHTHNRTTQVLTWFAIPIMQGFADAGDFSILGKLRTSLRVNLRFWMIMGSLALVGLLFLLFTGRLNGIDLYKTAIIASNTYGLIAIMVLLGYGLVEIPRNVWRRSFPEARLKWHHYRVGKAAERLQTASYDLQRLLQVVQATSGPISRRDPLRGYMDIIVRFVEHYSPLALYVKGLQLLLNSA